MYYRIIFGNLQDPVFLKNTYKSGMNLVVLSRNGTMRLSNLFDFPGAVFCGRKTKVNKLGRHLKGESL